MSDSSSEEYSQHGEELSSQQREKTLEQLEDLFTSEDPAKLSDTFRQLLTPNALQLLQERLREVQGSDDDLFAIFLQVALSLLQDAQRLGIAVVVTRYLRERQAAIEALNTLESKSDNDEFYQTLIEQQQTLLSDLALALLTYMYYNSLDREDNGVEAGSIKQHMALIKDARVSGVTAAWKRTLAEHKQLGDTLDLLEQQNTPEAFYHFLQEKREILITEKAIWLLQSHVMELRQQGDPMADLYAGHAFLLKDAYTRNLADAWEDFTGVDSVIQAIQATDEPEEILKIMQKHEKVLRSDAALVVLRSYIARAKADGAPKLVVYYERWFHLLEDARDSGITAAWSQFYYNLVLQITGQQGSSAAETIDNHTRALSRLTPGTLEWADMLSNRGQAYYYLVVGAYEKKVNLELAIADYNAALPVYRASGKQGQYAETLEMLGTIRFLYLLLKQGHAGDLKRAVDDFVVALIGTREDIDNPFQDPRQASDSPSHDPPQYRQLAIDHFTEALALYKKQGRQADWVRTLLKRAAAYRLGGGWSVEGTLLAIGDYSAALTVLRKETSPLEWMAAIWNRGVCYLHMMGDGYEERLAKAIADLDAALTVCTRQASPARYRRTQLFLYQAFERLGKWEEAYKAIREAIAVQRDLLAANPGEGQRQDLIADVANIQVEIYVRAAEVLLHFNRPPLPEMACLLEEGRAQNLRLALSLDTLDPEHISDPAARRRAERFLAARNAWQQQQNQITNWFMSPGKTTTTGVSQGQLDQQAQENHAAFVKTIEAIRKHDDPDFMAPTPTFDDILRAVSTLGTALVYLAAGAEGGLALMIMRNGKGTLQTHSLPLPQLKARAISHLLETDPTKHIPIKLEHSLLTLAETGLNEVAQVLSWNDVQKVRLIPFGLLGLFPFPAVQVRSSSGEKKCLGDLFEVTIAPSARAIEIAEKRAAHLDRRTHPSLLLGGDPRPRPAKVKGLPYAEAEADTVQRIVRRFGYEEKNIHYLRPVEVTKAKVTDILNHTWYAQLAIHGTYHPDNPRRSHLILAGYKDMEESKYCIFLGEALDRRTLDGQKTFNLEGVRLLVLSACETAIIDVKHVPDEFIGLAAGFLQAGVAGVIASLWAVDDRATYLLMTRFAQLYLDPQKKYSPAQALARAQRWLREEATNKVLMTYDPVKGFPTNSASGQAQAGKKTRANEESMFRDSSLRSTRYSYKAGITEIHEKSKFKSFNDPDAIPYANPVFWAAFVVTGC